MSTGGNLAGPMAWRYPDGNRVAVVRCRDCGWVASRSCPDAATPEVLGLLRTLADGHACRFVVPARAAR